MTKVSIIIPIYNVEKYLKKCLDSVVNQTLQDIEIICINDGSKDNSKMIILEYAAKDSRIKVIDKENEGYGKTMNLGLSIATGQYIGIVEPDDFIDLEMYNTLYSIAQKNNSDIVKSAYFENRIIKDAKPELKTPFKDSTIVPKQTFKISECGYFLRKHPSIWTCIYKKEFLDKHNIKFVEAPGAGWTDNPFMVQTLCLAEKIDYIPKPFYYWTNEAKTHSEALKDYTLPFDRCDEIHTWLSNNNITNEEILQNLYKKKLQYIDIAIGVKSLNLLECSKRIKSLLKRLNPDIIYNDKYKFNSLEKRTYKIAKNHPLLWIFKRRYYDKIKPILYSKTKQNNHLIIQLIGIKFKFKIK